VLTDSRYFTHDKHTSTCEYAAALLINLHW